MRVVAGSSSTTSTWVQVTAPNFADKTIWTGDNLDIMRGMNSESVDLCYLDPPFNSNRNYAAPVGSQAAGAAFKDTWTLSDLDVAWMGLIADEQPAMYKVLETAGLTHGKGMQSYLCMMGVRLLEMRRVLKETGSIYLHCDPTASHYLKLLMDAVFGADNFRNEVSWNRSNPKSLHVVNFPNNRDIILRYSRGQKATFHKVFLAHNPTYVDKAYKYTEEDGRRYRLLPLLNPSSDRPNLTYEFLGVTRVWRWTHKRMQKAYEDGIVVQLKPGAVPQYKYYLEDSKGRTATDDWNNILQTAGRERIGYPTQKPLVLLERIIKASSNEGDVVLDPFCGCATACVAAENLGRQWVGIDISPKAVELVNTRLQQTMGNLFHHGYVTHRTDIPRRTDIDVPVPYRQNKHILFGQQEGQCGGCKTEFPFKLFEVDHVIPRSRGGTNHPDNLQLLCSHCNRVKGDKNQAHLMARLKEMSTI